MVPNGIFEMTFMNWVKILLEKMRKAKDKGKKKAKAPIIEVLDKKQANIDFVTLYKNEEPNSPTIRKASTMKELSYFIDNNGSDKEVLMEPSQYHPSLMVMHTENMQSLLSTPLKVTLTLAKFLKVKPKLWQEVTMCLKKMGIYMPNEKFIETIKETKVAKNVKCEPIPINKVGDYCEGKDENTTLPMESNDM